jgi:hypothetical protein
MQRLFSHPSSIPRDTRSREDNPEGIAQITKATSLSSCDTVNARVYLWILTILTIRTNVEV